MSVTFLLLLHIAVYGQHCRLYIFPWADIRFLFGFVLSDAIINV